VIKGNRPKVASRDSEDRVASAEISRDKQAATRSRRRMVSLGIRLEWGQERACVAALEAQDRLTILRQRSRARG
jgi:hypothetical protein